MVAVYLKKPLNPKQIQDALERVLVYKENEEMVAETRDASYSKRKTLEEKSLVDKNTLDQD